MAENPGTEKTSSPLHENVRIRLAVWWTGGVIILAALIIVLLWKVPQWQVGHVNGLTPKEWFDRVNEARKTLATILGGIVVLAGAYFTWRNISLTQESVATAQKALLVSQEGQITDRYTKAIEQLGAVDANGKKKLEVRLGGIYALERIANQSEKDHWPVIEVLSACVRENALSKRQGSTRENRVVAEIPAPLAADIQAILTVLGRRDRKYEHSTQELDLRGTDLSEAKLSRSNLPRSLMSAESSGGLRSSATRIPLTMVETHSLNASRISLSSTVIALGMPSMRLRPLISMISGLSRTYAEPVVGS